MPYGAHAACGTTGSTQSTCTTASASCAKSTSCGFSCALWTLYGRRPLHRGQHLLKAHAFTGLSNVYAIQDDHAKVLVELSKLAIINNYTMVLAWRCAFCLN